MFTNIKEIGFETLIVNYLVEQNGYEQGINAGYNRDYAIDEIRLFRFLCGSQAEVMERLGVEIPPNLPLQRGEMTMGTSPLHIKRG